jgi:hypothetical protein
LQRDFHYRVAGFQLRSDFPIFDLSAIDPGHEAADVHIRMGSVPAVVHAPRLSLSWLQANLNECRVDIPSIGRFFISGGNEVLVDPDSTTANEDLTPYLLGVVVGALSHQRNLLALHANAVEVEDGCVAFLGPSGAGKSTLTGFLAERGYRMVTDDVSLVRFKDGHAKVSATAPRLKLWKNTVEALGRSSENLKRVIGRIEKYSLPVDQAIDGLPLRRVYLLSEPSERDADGISRITGAAAMKSLADNLYCPELGWATRGESIFTQCRTLLDTVECYRLTRALGFAEMGAIIDRLEQHFGVGEE